MSPEVGIAATLSASAMVSRRRSIVCESETCAIGSHTRQAKKEAATEQAGAEESERSIADEGIGTVIGTVTKKG